MKQQESLAQHFGIIYQVAAKNTDGMNQEHSLAQPSGGNCANWILGHLTNVQNGVMKLLGEQPVWENEQLKRAGFDPITAPSNAIEWNTLRDRFLESKERCLAAVSRVTDEALAETVPHPFGGTCRREELLNVLAFHQAYHVGQLAIARRAAGLEGVIKGPGQPQAAVA